MAVVPKVLGLMHYCSCVMQVVRRVGEGDGVEEGTSCHSLFTGGGNASARLLSVGVEAEWARATSGDNNIDSSWGRMIEVQRGSATRILFEVEGSKMLR